MSTGGQAAGGIVGAIAGALLAPATAGASLTWALYGAQAGMMVGGLLDPPKGPSQHGPSPDALRLTTSTYGANIPRLYGTVPVAGNVIWLEGGKYKVKKKKSGGKGGGSVATYKLFATFAVLLGKGPIVGIRRLWLGSNLVYDGAAATTSGVIKSGKSKSTWKLYTGTDTQQPDPRYQADVGVNAASGWPGEAYIVFYDLPLEKYQNTLAGVQIKAEIVTDGSTAWSQIVGVTNTGKQFADNGAIGLGYPYVRGMVGGIIYVNVTDGLVDYMFTADGVFKGTKPVARPAIKSNVGLGGGVIAYCLGAFGDSYLWATGGSTELNTNVFTAEDPFYPVRQLGGNLPSTKIHAVVMSTDNATVMLFTAENLGAGYRWYELDASGAVLSTGVYGAITLSNIFNTYGLARGGAPNGHFGSSCYDRDSRVLMVAYGAGGPDTVYFYSIDAGGTLTQLYNPAMLNFNNTFPACFLVGRVGYVFSKSTYQVYAEQLTVNPVGLDEIVEAECIQSNLLTAGDLDVTGLAADMVRGFRVSDTGPIRANLEPLSLIWPFDVRMHGYKLQFVRRGGASVASIPAADLDARLDGSDPGPMLTIPRDMDSQLPQKVVLGFLDVDREYDRGEQSSVRYNTDARNIFAPEVAIVLNGQEGKRAAEVLLYNYWRERGADIQLNLPPTYLHLEPADVVDVTAPDGAVHVLRLTNINTTPAGIQQCTARRDKPGGYTSPAVAETGTDTGAGLLIYGPTIAALLDIPALTAAENTPGVYAAACGVLSTWPGAILYGSYDDGQDWDDLTAWDNDSFIGIVPTALGAATCFDRIDAAGTLTVSPYAGTLASVTENQMLGGANNFAYGVHGRWEILAARTATLNGDGTYTLQDFLRGRLGTEQYASTHQANDLLVQLTTTETVFVSRSTAQIGLAALFRPVTLDEDFDDVEDEAFTYTGVNLKPLSPVDLNGNRHPSTNDWTLTVVPRYRINTEWRDYVDVAEDEASTSFQMDIYADGTYATVKRTIAATGTSPSFPYSSANQVVDFGSNQATLYTKTYKISATVGRGYPLTTSITR